ncbi:LamG domain-containing protein [Pirellulales bacterium]|nr:LamG domain-containing protein [Pirellulales bacterium]
MHSLKSYSLKSVALLGLCTAAAAAADVSFAPIPTPDPNTVGLWLLDETEGPAGEENWGVYDQSGHGNHGVREPIGSLNSRPRYRTDVPSAAPWNYSLDFGVSSSARVEIPDSASLDLTSGFTVEAWVNLNGIAGEQYLVSKRNTSGPASGYILEYSGGSQTFQFNVGDGNGYTGVASSDFTPTSGQWHHVAGVHDPNAGPGELQLYIDGQLNNSVSVSPTVAINSDPLWLGDWADGGKAANAKLDQVRISSRVVPPSELGFSHEQGPANTIFGDSFESYDNTSELLSRSGGERNHWKAEVFGPDTTFDLINAHSHSPGHSMLMQHLNANSDGNLSGPFYNLPLGATRDEPIVATSGWVSFTGEENVRLFFQNQIWTGNENHYGVTETLLAGGIQYWGTTRTWRYESAAGNGTTTVTFSDPIIYDGDLDTWHYYRFVMDHDNKEYVSFQFDDQVWDLSGLPFLTIPNFKPGLLPVVDHNVRLLELPNPPHPYTAQFALDDAVITVGSGADFDADGDIDGSDFLSWQRGMGLTHGAKHSQGDGDGSGGVDVVDRILWDSGFGAIAALPAATRVPEPSSGILLVISAALLTRIKGLHRDARGSDPVTGSDAGSPRYFVIPRSAEGSGLPLFSRYHLGGRNLRFCPIVAPQPER